MILALFGTFLIGFLAGHTHQMKSLGDSPVTVLQQGEWDRMQCLNAAKTSGQKEECEK